MLESDRSPAPCLPRAYPTWSAPRSRRLPRKPARMANALIPTPADRARRRPAGAAGAPPAAGARRHQVTRAAFQLHLWVGVAFTAALLVIAVTGIALNHKRGLGIMPDVEHEPTAPFASALPLATLADIGLRAGLPAGTEPDAATMVDRMDVRPRDGYVKVRLRDRKVTEVTVDLSDGRVLHVGARGDAFIEKLHSGEVFGKRWVLLSDAAAVALVLTLISGYWLWMAPRIRRSDTARRGAP